MSKMDILVSEGEPTVWLNSICSLLRWDKWHNKIGVLLLILFTVVQLHLSPFFPHYSPLPYPHLSSHIQSSPTIVFAHGSFICMFLDLTLPLLSTINPLPSPPHPSGYFQSAPRFHASGSILFISLICSLDSSYRWDHMVFVSHHLAYFT